MKAVARGKAKAGKVVPKKPDKKQLAAEMDAQRKKDALAIQKGVTLLPGMPKLDEDGLKAKAAEVDKAVREIEKHSKVDFAQLGFRLIEMEHYALWRFIEDEKGYSFPSMKAWLKTAAPFSYAAGMASKSAIAKLIGYVPKDEIKLLPPYAIKAMSKLPPSKRSNKKILEAAKAAGKGKKNKQGRKKLFETINAEAPEAHVEDVENVKIEKSLRPLYTRSIEIAKWLMDDAELSDTEALESILNYFLDGPCEKESGFGKTNAVAYAEHQAAVAEASRVFARNQEEEVEPGEDLDGEEPEVYEDDSEPEELHGEAV